MTKLQPVRANPVAKHGLRVNRSSTEPDRKAEAKRTHRTDKHKGAHRAEEQA